MTPRPRTIDSETSIVPHSVATAVLEEASRWLGTPLPRHWARQLAERANTVYACNAQFRRSLNLRGNTGRDLLWAFTRHWLCAMIARHRPHLHKRLPSSYNVGYDLPPSPMRNIKIKPRSRAPASSAAAAHFQVLT